MPWATPSSRRSPCPSDYRADHVARGVPRRIPDAPAAVTGWRTSVAPPSDGELRQIRDRPVDGDRHGPRATAIDEDRVQPGCVGADEVPIVGRDEPRLLGEDAELRQGMGVDESAWLN